MSDEVSNNDHKTDQVSIEFLVSTLASLQFALKSIERDIFEKTDVVDAISDNINVLVEGLKHINARNTSDSERMISLEKEMGVFISKADNYFSKADGFQSLIVYHQGNDLKEMRYAISEINKTLIRIDAANTLLVDKIQSKKEETDRKDNLPKDGSSWSVFKMVNETFDALKNIKTIVVVIMAVLALIFSMIYGISSINGITEFLKNLAT